MSIRNESGTSPVITGSPIQTASPLQPFINKIFHNNLLIRSQSPKRDQSWNEKQRYCLVSKFLVRLVRFEAIYRKSVNWKKIILDILFTNRCQVFSMIFNHISYLKSFNFPLTWIFNCRISLQNISCQLNFKCEYLFK